MLLFINYKYNPSPQHLLYNYHTAMSFRTCGFFCKPKTLEVLRPLEV